MSCEICGSSNCTRSFHSLEEQQNFDDQADSIKERAKEILASRVDRLDYICLKADEDDENDNTEEIVYVKLDDVIKTIEDYS